MIRQARIWLIRLGKTLPFIVCFVVLISYVETALNLATYNVVSLNGGIIPYKCLSWFIGHYFEYNIQMLFVLVVISVAIETCVYNKLACLYLAINLAEKSYFDFELEPTNIYIIYALNIIASGYLTYKGIKILTTQ